MYRFHGMSCSACSAAIIAGLSMCMCAACLLPGRRQWHVDRTPQHAYSCTTRPCKERPQEQWHAACEGSLRSTPCAATGARHTTLKGRPIAAGHLECNSHPLRAVSRATRERTAEHHQLADACSRPRSPQIQSDRLCPTYASFQQKLSQSPEQFTSEMLHTLQAPGQHLLAGHRECMACRQTPRQQRSVLPCTPSCTDACDEGLIL